MPVSTPTNAINANTAPVETTGGTSRVAVVLKMEKETPTEENAALRTQLREARLALTLQGANAEQARRTALCLRQFHDALLLTLDQPCLILDRDGFVSFWNDAIAAWTGITALFALGRDVETLFPPEAAEALDAAFQVAAHDVEAASPSATSPAPIRGIFSPDAQLPDATFVLLPLCHVPGCLESCVILFHV